MTKKITDYFSVFKPENLTHYNPPLLLNNVQAGFPSPADDHIDSKLDLNEFLIKHPSATFFVKAAGDSMTDAGINEGDILIVDRSVDAKSNDIIVASLCGEFTLKRLIINGEKVYLKPENPKYNLIEINEDSLFSIWGVVTYVISKK